MKTETLMRYISGQLSSLEGARVYEWISSSPENLKQYQDLRRLYDVCLWNAPVKSPKVRARRRYNAWAWSFAAAAIAALGVFLFNAGKQSVPEPLYSIESVTAPTGQEMTIALSDGTKVWLNSGSTLSFSESSHERRVALRGEGFFDVAKDSEHPFIVETDQFDIKVLGTRFNVAAYDDNRPWETALVSGSVAVTDKNGQHVMTLAPSSKVTLVDGRLSVTPYNEDNYLWRHGILYFDKMTISDIVDRLSSYYGVDIDLVGVKDKDKKYTGKFRNTDGLQHILKVLQMDNDFSYITNHE